jgi:hypothetical protein
MLSCRCSKENGRDGRICRLQGSVNVTTSPLQLIMEKPQEINIKIYFIEKDCKELDWAQSNING